jgi:YgiT-type zinc finger domain-containing protein
METRTTLLPFKTGPESIVIIKDLPVTECTNCHEYLLDDLTMTKVESLLDNATAGAELEVVRFAA